MPRAGLTPARVVAEAAAIADADGLEALTLAALADRTGVRVPSLYKHVRGLPEIRRRLALDGLADLGRRLAEAAAGAVPREAALQEVAAAYRRFARSSPGRYAAAQRAPDPGDEEWARASGRVASVLFDLLTAYDVPEAGRIHAARAVRAALHGFVDLERAGGFGLPEDVDESYRRLVDLLDLGLRGAPAGQRGARGGS
ncbi:MAG: TetR-like C-terminal domain-containing protein [Kineosporiaceae bacterium]